MELSDSGRAGADGREAEAAPRYYLGIDTGGTYTDAVLIDEARRADGPPAVVAKAKALTTRDDLAIGIGAAIDAVLAPDAAAGRPDGVAPEQIVLVSLSTTLATNALVEGKGGRVALVMIGFGPADMRRAGLAEALGDDPLIALAGGHGAAGAEQAPLDLGALEGALAGLAVDGFAVCGHFAVRNPEHEVRVRDAIRAATGRPVTCSHELSAKIGGPKRALTALLNGRLIGMIDALIAAAERLLARRRIGAPLMVVRGDGALVAAGFARARPIETILSGPAASLVGAAWLTGRGDAVVSDIGGTTTDIAVLHDGRPRLDPAGATVGGWRTMVEAVAVTTHGLGGDSEVAADPDVPGHIRLGPRRAVPVSLLALDAGAMVHAALDRQLARPTPNDLDGRFLIPAAGARPPGLGSAETAVLDALAGGPRAADEVLRTRPLRTALRRLGARGLVMLAAFTPSDAAHVVGRHAGWDGAAAQKAARLLARQRDTRGEPLAASAELVAQAVLDRLVRRSAELVLDAAFAHDGCERPEPSRSFLAAQALDGRAGLVRPRLDLTVPLVGLGAPAPVYYPAVAGLVGAEHATPVHADVANAIGAVVGGVRVSRSVAITCPADGVYRAHLPDGPQDFGDAAAAREVAVEALSRLVRQAAAEAGAAEPELSVAEEAEAAEVEGRRMLLELRLTVTAAGRPRLADAAPAADLPPGFTGV